MREGIIDESLRFLDDLVFVAGFDDGVGVTLQASRALLWAPADGVVSAAGFQGDGVCRRGEHIEAG